MPLINTLERFLKRFFKWEDIGWKEIDEIFLRFYIFKCRWFSIKVHKMMAPKPHKECHDHPWHFWTFIFYGGYDEVTNTGTKWQGAGSLLYRNALFTHNTISRTLHWSLILTSHKKRAWGHKPCG